MKVTIKRNAVTGEGKIRLWFEIYDVEFPVGLLFKEEYQRENNFKSLFYIMDRIGYPLPNVIPVNFNTFNYPKNWTIRESYIEIPKTKSDVKRATKLVLDGIKQILQHLKTFSEFPKGWFEYKKEFEIEL